MIWLMEGGETFSFWERSNGDDYGHGGEIDVMEDRVRLDNGI